MSYILFLGFKSVVYKEPAVMRIYLDDMFVDEFTVDPPRVCDQDNDNLWSDIRDKFWKENLTKLDPVEKNKKYIQSDIFVSKENHNSSNKFNSTQWQKKNPRPSSSLVPRWKKNTNYEIGNTVRAGISLYNVANFFNEDLIFKTIELDSSVIDNTDKHKLRLEIINANNNYTNGFMTKSTLVRLYMAYVVPKHVLKDVVKEPISFFSKFQDRKMKIKSTQSGVAKIKSYYKYDDKLALFDIIANNFKYYDTLTYYNNYTKAKAGVEGQEWVGSPGYWHLPFETEWITVQKSTSEFGKYDLTDDLLYFIAHKYKQYEN